MVTCIFGLPGCGKTTVLTAIAQREMTRIMRGRSKYKRVYTTWECAGLLQIDGEALKDYDFRDCLVIIDEITLLWDSRSFKQFPPRIKELFTLHRHYNCDIIYATQYYLNVDKRIRDVTARTYYIRRGIFLSTLILCPIKVIFPQDTGEILVGHVDPGFFGRLLGRRYFRPRWYRYFDSWESDTNVKNYPPIPYGGLPAWARPIARRSHRIAKIQAVVRTVRNAIIGICNRVHGVFSR